MKERIQTLRSPEILNHELHGNGPRSRSKVPCRRWELFIRSCSIPNRPARWRRMNGCRPMSMRKCTPC